ncbi:Tim44 domain-containing protein [Variovorax terrae]|uniref:Tim44-like domain-containing protein n=1 Tax=Variovorax terrae TaxID=2923278 RepID=A0A9X1VY74_9BURK|nr:Tim44-like domain-containing protein [Variovorax terrae]MCJ0765084.1 Tim44-like domain-containing protein [Variovorax terrae]
MKFWSLFLVLALVFVSADADAARRLGGGKSMGKQSGNVTQREAAPAAPAAPAGGAAQSAAKPAPAPGAAPAAAAAPKKPWGAMLGGLAAGLGLAWLANSLGLGAAFGQFMLIALLVLVVMVVVGMVMRARKGNSAASSRSPFAFQGAGATAEAATPPRQYSPDNVGNDASARPWERSSMAFDSGRFQTDAAGASGGLVIGSALGGSQSWGIPAGFDTEGFLGAAKRNFVTLQDAWDRSDIGTLRSMMTDGMVGEIKSQLAERENHLGGQPNRTDVVMLDAQLLGIEDLGQDYMASVEFSGMIREQPSAGPSPFREVWNMTKPKSGSNGWLVAGVQALQ